MISRRKPIPKPITADQAPAAAKQLALKLLAVREHTALELRHKLSQRNFASPVIDAVLNELIAADYLSETRFAEVYAHSRADKGYGPLRIRRELRERGVSEDCVANVLQTLDDFWMPRLAALQRKRFGVSPPPDMLSKARQVRFLRQRGFTPEQIKILFQDL